MMKCPRDVRKEDFETMLKSVPHGFVLERSYIPRSPYGYTFWRDFIFVVRRPISGFKRGDHYHYSCVRKIGVKGVNADDDLLRDWSI